MLHSFNYFYNTLLGLGAILLGIIVVCLTYDISFIDSLNFFSFAIPLFETLISGNFIINWILAISAISVGILQLFRAFVRYRLDCIEAERAQ